MKNKNIRPVQVKEWLVNQIVAKKVPGIKGKSWWSVSNLEIAVLLGWVSQGTNAKAANKRIYEMYAATRVEHKTFQEQTVVEIRAMMKEPKKRAAPSNPNSDKFLASYAWRQLRMSVLKKYGPRCQCCGAGPKDGIVIHVDHIKPRRTHPALALDIDNLQILCEVCNHGKGNWDSTDWRPQEPLIEELDDAAAEHLRSIH